MFAKLILGSIFFFSQCSHFVSSQQEQEQQQDEEEELELQVNSTEALTCLQDIQKHFPLYMATFGFDTIIDFQYPHNEILKRWKVSLNMAENCVRHGKVLFSAVYDDMPSLQHGLCLPHSCESEYLAEIGLDYLLYNAEFKIAKICTTRKKCPTDTRLWKPVKLRKIGLLSDLNLDFAIVGYDRCSTSALLNHLVFGEHEKVQFDLPGVNLMNLSKKRAFEDTFFGYKLGKRIFPTLLEVEEFNSKNSKVEKLRRNKNFTTS